jgi:hypothetical protein
MALSSAMMLVSSTTKGNSRAFGIEGQGFSEGSFRVPPEARRGVLAARPESCSCGE